MRTYKQSSFDIKYDQTSNQQSKPEKEAPSSTRKQKANNVISTPIIAYAHPHKHHMYSTCSHTDMKLITQAKNLEHTSQ